MAVGAIGVVESDNVDKNNIDESALMKKECLLNIIYWTATALASYSSKLLEQVTTRRALKSKPMNVEFSLGTIETFVV